MSRPRKYIVSHTARFDKETGKLLVKKGKLTKMVPAVVIRALVEKSLKGDESLK